MALLDNVRAALRITTTSFDTTEITPIINACKIDLGLAGVNIITDDDSMVIRAVVLYAKANFGYSDDSEKYQAAYARHKDAMALAPEYRAYKVTFTVTHDAVPLKDASIAFDGETVLANSLGVAVFYTRKHLVDVDYTVTSDYGDAEGYVYVDGAETVSVVI